jgi:hypothetical protein
MSLLRTTGNGAVTAGGRAIGAAFEAVAHVRSAAKPLHPLGSVSTGRLHRFGGELTSGAGWLDEAGEDEVLLRLSRSVGLPPPLPDVFGMALRVPLGGASGAYGDLRFSGTGTGPLSRFVFRPGRTLSGHPMGTVLPYRTPAGPTLLLAVPRSETAFDLCWAVGRGPWVRFASLDLDPEATAANDAPVSFDPVRNPLPGLEVYSWVRRLREPSYSRARRSRGLSR